MTTSAAASSPTSCSGRGRSGWSSSSSSRCTTWRELSLESGVVGELRIQLALVELHRSAVSSTTPSSCARSSTPALATLLALLIAYPLAYAIAFKAGRWRNVMLFAVVAPVLHHLPDPDPRLGDDPLRREPGGRTSSHAIGLAPERPRPGHQRRRDRRPHLQLPAVHDPADLRQPRADRRAADRGGEGPLRLGDARPSCG